MLKVEVLMSVMFQNGIDIVERSRINSDVLLVNQCDRNESMEVVKDNRTIRCISTTNRGLSNSRNMAIENATGDLCLLCDDDEVLHKDYIKRIVTAFENNEKADIICFIVKRKNKRYFPRPYKVGYFSSLKMSSWQIVLKLKSIREAGIKFDEKFGAGTPNGSGEENIFLFDCLKKKLNIYYVPICIGKVNPSESTWFKGFNEDYFIKRGRIFRKLFGLYGYVHSIYFCVSKYKRYKDELTFASALRFLYRGMRSREKEEGMKN